MSQNLQVKGNGPFEVVESDTPIEGYRTMSRAEYAALAASYVPAPYVPSYVELREAAYIAEGITPDAIAIAIAERDGEGRPEAFAAMQAKRAAIKARYPKPL